MEENLQDRTKVRIYTEQYMILGDIAMFADSRLTDFMVGANEFIALTNVAVSNLDGKTLFKSSFMNVQTEKIIIILPENMVLLD